MATRPTIPVRLDEAMVARLDAVAEAMSKRAAGASVSRSEVVRVAVDRGVSALEAELGVAPKRKRR